MTRKENHRSIGRSLAIPMIAIGAACCASIELVQGHWPEIAAVPGTAGSVAALLGLLLLFRSQLREKREERAQKEECVRISPYVPEMVDGSNGAEVLKVVLEPVPQTVRQRPRQTRTEPLQSLPANTGTAPFFVSTGTDPVRSGRQQRKRTSATMIAALRFGSEWTRDVQLSRRAMARLESDPFVQRLARLG